MSSIRALINRKNVVRLGICQLRTFTREQRDLEREAVEDLLRQKGKAGMEAGDEERRGR